jgi:hypothetical protein
MKGSSTNASCRLVAVLLAALGSTSPAEPQQADRRERMYQAYLNLETLIKGGDVTARWLADGNRFWYAERAADTIAVHLVDPRANTRSAFFDTGRLRRALRETLGHEPPYRGVPFEMFTLEQGFRLDRESYALTELPPVLPREQERTVPRKVRESFPETGSDIYELRSPDGQWFLGEARYNLTLRSTYDGREVPAHHGRDEG